MEKFQWLAAVIAAHPEHKVIGRTRLQKTVKLLMRLGAPMDYDFMIHFYGPYSEGIPADIGLLQNFKLIEENVRFNQDGSPYYILQATEAAIKLTNNKEFVKFKKAIDSMSSEDPVVLELAATYDTFREMGYEHKKALEHLRQKKEEKCTTDRINKAIKLLDDIGLKE